MSKNKPNLITYIVAISFLLVALSLGYYFVFALPKIQSDKQLLEQQKFELELEQNQKQSELEKNYKTCDKEADIKAREILESKLDVMISMGATNSQTYNSYKAAKDNGMYLKDDFNEAYKNCLRKYGLEEK
ncbi:hypothetical protein A2375_02055 [Candidatus Woesebacteria bacterium RIFOXYB1_FULL_31_120]|nr:MAG: hypothetical protein A2375_02055 [Candidatus Woesebacteria bacterium RIFOXYB1_FULL_31_120]